MYPRLNANQAVLVRDSIIAAQNEKQSRDEVLALDLSSFIEYGDSTTDISVEYLDRIAKAAQNDLLAGGLVDARKKDAHKQSTTPGDYMEELMTERLHKDINHLDPRALHDPGFWRFLGLFPYRWYLLEREPELKAQDFGGTEGGKTYWLMLRTFIVGQKARREGIASPYRNTLAYRDARRKQKISDGRTVDFYHSHIVRKRWNDYQIVTNVFIECCTAPEYALDINEKERYSNELAKRMRRISPSILLDVLPENKIRIMMDSEKAEVLM
jgi:hypothetical protein